MRAVVINNYGSIEEMLVQQIPLPKVGVNDVLIEVHAAAVNPVDVAIRNGWLQERYSYKFPLVLGWDVAGIVSAVGANVSKFKVGDEVYSSPELGRNGTYAEYVTVAENFVTLKPKNLSYQEAASIPLVGITAYRALVEFGGITEGQRVLILGGAGGVGSFAIQLAKSFGAYVATTTSTSNIELVKSLGADEVIDYTIFELSGYIGDFDLVFDTVGRTSFEQSFELVRKGGRVVSIATFFNENDFKHAEEKEVALEFFFSNPSGDILTKITRLVELEKIKPVIGIVYPLEQAAKAHQLSESKRSKGKIVLQVK